MYVECMCECKFVRLYSSILGHKNCQIETAVWNWAGFDSWSLSHLGYLYPGTAPAMIKLDHDRSCPWVQIGQVTKAPTNITKVPCSAPGSTRVIIHRGVFRLRVGVQK